MSAFPLRRDARAALVTAMTIYAIGDIHGHLAQLQAAHDRIAADRARMGDARAPVIHLGDLVDRGPNAAGVIDWLAARTARDPRMIVLLGNHDQMMLRWLETGPGPDPRDPPNLRYLAPGMGGRETLASYDIDPDGPPGEVHAEARDRIPATHRAFLAARPVMHRAGECIFVHAGIRPGISLDKQAIGDLVWIRQDFLTSTHDHGPLVVHGHTPVSEVEHHGNRLAIDTGAAYGRPLSAVAIEGRDAYVLTDDGRVPVRWMR